MTYATLVFHNISSGEYFGTSIAHSEEEALEILRTTLFNKTTRKLRVYLEERYSPPDNCTLDATTHLSAYELADLNNNCDSQAYYSVNGSIGGKVIHFQQ